MRKIFLLLAMGMAFTSMAQKTITCKKGSVKQEDRLIAEYDAKGGMFRLTTLGVFAPGTKDTLIKVTEEIYDAQNPMFPGSKVVYKVEFNRTPQPAFYVRHPKHEYVRNSERDIMGMLFNDTVPVLIVDSKLNEEAVSKFRSQHSYAFEEAKAFIKHVEDSIAILNQAVIVRDVTKPVSFKQVNNSELGPDYSLTFEIYQDGVLLGRMLKKVQHAIKNEASYSFWKKIAPVTVSEIDMAYSPVAFCITGPTPFDIPIITVIGKTEHKIKGNYEALENQIVKVLIDNKLL